MLHPDLEQIRLFLHVLGACIWLGGQIVLGGLVPVLRAHGDQDLVRRVARQFQRLAWPGYVLLLATGIWNLSEVHADNRSNAYLVTLFVKLALVGLSGIAAATHSLLTGPSVARAANEAEAARRRAFSGASAGLALLFTLIAAFLGVQLHAAG
jgi:putative copper export protein